MLPPPEVAGFVAWFAELHQQLTTLVRSIMSTGVAPVPASRSPADEAAVRLEVGGSVEVEWGQWLTASGHPELHGLRHAIQRSLTQLECEHPIKTLGDRVHHAIATLPNTIMLHDPDAPQAEVALRRVRWWWPWGARVRRYAALTQRATEQLRRGFANMRGPKNICVITSRQRATLALAEASRGYDLAILTDVQRGPGSRSLFSTTVDSFLRNAPCSTMLIMSPRPSQPCDTGAQPFVPWSPRTILVPTVGTERCRHAVEVGAVLAASTGALLVILNVIRGADPSRDEMARDIVSHHAAWAERFGARAETQLVKGLSPDQKILVVAREREVDLIVLGSGLRVSNTRAFFGHRIERMLEQTQCPIAVVSAP